jgi:hypothetical protein
MSFTGGRRSAGERSFHSGALLFGFAVRGPLRAPPNPPRRSSKGKQIHASCQVRSRDFSGSHGANNFWQLGLTLFGGRHSLTPRAELGHSLVSCDE